MLGSIMHFVRINKLKFVFDLYHIMIPDFDPTRSAHAPMSLPDVPSGSTRQTDGVYTTKAVMFDMSDDPPTVVVHNKYMDISEDDAYGDLAELAACHGRYLREKVCIALYDTRGAIMSRRMLPDGILEKIADIIYGEHTSLFDVDESTIDHARIKKMF
jgi:hypothetical protein